MGYRSNVVIKSDRTIFDEINEIAIKNDLPMDKVIHDTETDYYTIIWQDVKWYSIYPEVTEIENVIKKYECSEEHPYQYIRIGEDYNDIEIDNNDLYDLDIDIHVRDYTQKDREYIF